MVDRVAVEDVVDPAPGDVAADRWQWQGPDAFEKGVPTEPRGGPQLGRRATGAGLPAALVERVEVAALVILVGRPAAGGDRPIDVLDADLEPVDDVGDVIEERPVRPTGVRGSRAGQSPGGIVEPGPRRREAVPHGRFVRPEITLRGSEVDRLDIGERRSAEIDVRDRCDGGELPIGAHRETMRSPLPSTVSRPTLASSWSPSSTVRR